MDKQLFIEQVERRLLQLFRASKQGLKTPAAERHRLEGFMQAGVFLQLVSRDELAQRMEQLHRLVFAQSIAERRKQQANTWPHEVLDYSEYDAPAFERYPAGQDACIAKVVVECDDTSAMDAEGRDR